MARRVGGNPAKTRLLPGVGYPIPINTPAPAAGGFTSAAAPWPFGFGSAGTTFTLTQSGAVSIGAAGALSGDLSYVAPFTVVQSGTLSISGTAATVADLSIATTRGFHSAAVLWPFGLGDVTNIVLTPTTPIGIVGSLGVAAEVDVGGEPFELVAPLDITPMVATVSVTGDINTTSALTLVQSGAIVVVASAAVTGNLGLAWALSPTGAIALAGAFSPSGNIGFSWALAQSGVLALDGALAAAGDVGFAWQIAPSGVVSLGAASQVSGDLVYGSPGGFTLTPTGAIPLAGAMQAQGDLTYVAPFNLAPTVPLAVAGAFSISGSLQFVAPFNLVLVAPVALTGTVTVNGDLLAGGPFTVETSGAIAATATAVLTGDLLAGGPFLLDVTAPITVEAVLNAVGNPRAVTPTTVPDVVGSDQETAETALHAAGLLATVTLVLTTEAPAGQVIAQSPAGGTPSFVGSTVEITVSQYNAAEILGENRNVRFKPIKRKRKHEEAPAEVAKAAPSPLLKGLVERTKPRSTGIGEVKARVAPVTASEIDLPIPQVVAAPAVAPAAAAAAAAAAAPTPAAPAAAPAAVDPVVRLEQEMTAFVEGAVQALTKQMAALEKLLTARTDELTKVRTQLDDLRKREINRTRAEALARQIELDG